MAGAGGPQGLLLLLLQHGGADEGWSGCHSCSRHSTTTPPASCHILTNKRHHNAAVFTSPVNVARPYCPPLLLQHLHTHSFLLMFCTHLPPLIRGYCVHSSSLSYCNSFYLPTRFQRLLQLLRTRHMWWDTSTPTTARPSSSGESVHWCGSRHHLPPGVWESHCPPGGSCSRPGCAPSPTMATGRRVQTGRCWQGRHTHATASDNITSCSSHTRRGGDTVQEPTRGQHPKSDV